MKTSPYLRALALLCLAILFCDCAVAADPKIVAHRGAALESPENTLPAIDRAIALGAAVVEIDLRYSADGEVVLMHDETVDRTTQGSGLVSRMTIGCPVQRNEGSGSPRGYRPLPRKDSALPRFERNRSAPRHPCRQGNESRIDRVFPALLLSCDAASDRCRPRVSCTGGPRRLDSVARPGAPDPKESAGCVTEQRPSKLDSGTPGAGKIVGFYDVCKRAGRRRYVREPEPCHRDGF